jgi:hypothetical protein
VAAVLFVAGVCLLALPGAGWRLGRRLAPAEWSRFCVAALLAGAVMVEVSLALYALPTVLRLLGAHELAHVCERMLPGGAPLSVPAVAGAVLTPMLAARGALRASRQQRAVHVEGCVGEHRRCGDHDLVVLPTDSVLAFCAHGRPPQVVVSEALVRSLSPDELDAVLRHEAAHLAHRHHRFLLMASTLEAGLGVLPYVRRSTAVLRTSLERWADEAAAGTGDASRATLRRALAGVTAAGVSRAVAAFSAEDTVAERLDALGGDPPRPSLLRRLAAYAPALVVCTVVIAALRLWGGEFGHLVARAGHCPS